MIAYQSYGNLRSAYWTKKGFGGDGLIRGSLFGRLLPRAWRLAAVEKGKIWDVSCVCPMKGLAKRINVISDDRVLGAVVRNLKAE